MLYISNRRNHFELSRIVKRLSDFKGSEGEEYIVRNKTKIERFDSFPIYRYRDGKLHKTDDSVVCGLFGI